VGGGVGLLGSRLMQLVHSGFRAGSRLDHGCLGQPVFCWLRVPSTAAAHVQCVRRASGDRASGWRRPSRGGTGMAASVSGLRVFGDARGHALSLIPGGSQLAAVPWPWRLCRRPDGCQLSDQRRGGGGPGGARGVTWSPRHDHQP
jgi:hypothetical protein